MRLLALINKNVSCQTRARSTNDTARFYLRLYIRFCVSVFQVLLVLVVDATASLCAPLLFFPLSVLFLFPFCSFFIALLLTCLLARHLQHCKHSLVCNTNCCKLCCNCLQQTNICKSNYHMSVFYFVSQKGSKYHTFKPSRYTGNSPAHFNCIGY